MIDLLTDAITILLRRKKETEHCIDYREVVDGPVDRKAGVGWKARVVRPLYLMKDAAKQLGDPEEIEVTFRAVRAVEEDGDA
jgi:hypothetical protein